MINTYFSCLIDYHNQLSGSAEEITEDSFVTQLFTLRPNKFATTKNMSKQHALPPTSNHIMDAIRLEEQKAVFVNKLEATLPGASG